MEVGRIFACLDSATHLAEEVPQPEKNIPIAIMATVGIGFVTAWFYCISMFFSLNDLDKLLNTATGVPILELYYQALDNVPGAIVLETLLLVTGMGCLIACSWDIDGYFSEVRKHAEALGSQRPAFLYSSLLPSLQGPEEKMSASVPVSAVFLADDGELVRQKIELAFSDDAGFDVETLFEYLNFFLEDDGELARLKMGFEHGNIRSIELRESLIAAVKQIVLSFQENRARVTDDYLEEIMTRRLIC